MSDINTLIADRYDEWITIWDGDKIVFKGICDNVNIINKVEENYSTTSIGDKSSYISCSSSIEGKVKISTKDNDVNLLLDCIRQNKKLTLHYRDNDDVVWVVPLNGYYYYANIFTYETLHIIDFSAKEISVYPNEEYCKNFVPYDDDNDEYENIEDVSRITIRTDSKTIKWDDISNVQKDVYKEKIQNEFGEEKAHKKGYYFRFRTRQDVFKDEFYGDNSNKLFQIFYKDKNKKPYMLQGHVDYLNIQEGIMGLDSYIQVFLKDYSVIEDKREEIRQACNLRKEDIEQLEKTLLTNDCILQPLTQSTTATITTGGFMDNSVCTSGFMHDSICTAYDTNLYVQSQEVTIGDKKFKTADLANALDKIVNNNKIASSTTNKEDKNMFNKMFSKYKFGKLDTKDIAYSMNGIAFRTSDGSYVVYNKDLTFTNVDNLVMDIPVFVMPVPLSKIKSGDVIVHYGAGSTVFVIVDSINDTDIFISDPHTRERKNLIPEKSIFGFDFVAKVMTPNTMFAADQSNPFGNMLPFMLMDEDANTDNLSFMMLFGQCSGETSWANQYLPFMLMNKGDNDMFKYMALMQMMNQNKETK